MIVEHEPIKIGDRVRRYATRDFGTVIEISERRSRSTAAGIESCIRVQWSDKVGK